MSKPNGADRTIKILLVDDVAETRESIRKLLAFESDFEVVGNASNGREAVELAGELEPDIILMDVNMPDMDGLEAAGLITRKVPVSGVIMMSVNNDPDYMQKAMMKGARAFLPKPIDMERLYPTVRNVYELMSEIRAREAAIRDRTRDEVLGTLEPVKTKEQGNRAGNILAVYSPQGGSGVTTIATNLASGLMKDGIKTLLVDADLEFGDVSAFLNLRAPTTVVDVVDKADDMDIEFFDDVITTHNSGLKVVLGAARPSDGMDVRTSRPQALSSVLGQVRNHYDFIVVDLPTSLNDVTLSLLDIATKIVLVTVPTLPSIKNTKFLLDLMDQSGYPPEKTMLVLNKVPESGTGKYKQVIPPPERIQSYLKRPVEGLIPMVDETIILNAINQGVPVIASDRDLSKAPIKQMLAFADHVYTTLLGIEDDDLEIEAKPATTGRPWNIFGR